MLLRLMITLNTLVFVLVIPMLELGPTHLYNPDWPGHARLHEAWQLLTNATLAMTATWLAWRTSHLAPAAGLSLILSVTFLVAHVLMGRYGGTMAHSDGSELLVGGVNPAFGVLLALALATAVLLALHRRARAPATRDTPQTCTKTPPTP